MSKAINLTGARLPRTDWHGAVLNGAKFAGAIMNNADLRGASMGKANFNDAVLNNVNLSRVMAEYADFSNAILDGANLRDGCFNGASFKNAIMNSADFRGAELDYADFERAILNNANVEGVDLSRARNLSAAAKDSLRFDDSTVFPAGFDLHTYDISTTTHYENTPRAPGSISIGGSISGSAVVVGSRNTVTMTITRTTLPPAEGVNIRAELDGLRAALAELRGGEAGKRDRAMQDALDEAQKPAPDKAEVLDSVQRALKYVDMAAQGAEKIDKLQQWIKPLAAWIGANAEPLLRMVGLSAF